MSAPRSVPESLDGPESVAVPEAFPPTLGEVMRRPRWIALLALALVVAAVFAWLGQWQLGNAIDTDPPPPGMTEQVRPLAEIVEPGEYLEEPFVGQRVVTDGEWIAGDFLVVSGRFNDGEPGYWVTGQLRVAERTSIAVALGFTSDEEEARAAASAFDTAPPGSEITGRIISDEGPQLPPPDDMWRMTRMSPAMLLSRWHDTERLNVYRPYLASQTAPEGLVDIVSPPPTLASPINWLNIFYAVEWAVFAGFAFYIWYRLARDGWEREVEELEERAAASA